MAGAPVITAYGVNKRFVTHRQRSTSIKERLVRRQRRVVHGEFWALRDINIGIAQGETVGLIGHNGSGKSTLLKMLAGILQPTSGEVHTLGRISSLLELGAGFAQELSGRDNVYLNASLLGLSRTQTDEMFDDILAFSELGDRIDDPVKVYSSGMYVKLGFAVAVHVDPDILLIDEVLAVGDEAFQEKCLAKVQQFKEMGKTILVVSHGLDQLVDICTRVVVLDHGQMQYDGDPVTGVALLRDLLGTTKAVKGAEDESAEVAAADPDEAGDVGDAAPDPEPAPEPEPLPVLAEATDEPEAEPVPDFAGPTFGISSVTVSKEIGGEPNYVFLAGDRLSVRVEVEVNEADGQAGEVAAVVMGPHHIPMWVMHGEGGGTVQGEDGVYHVDFSVDGIPPVMGPFAIAASIRDTTSGEVVAARTIEDAFAVPGDRALGVMDSRYDVTLTHVGPPAPRAPRIVPLEPAPLGQAPLEPARVEQAADETAA